MQFLSFAPRDRGRTFEEHDGLCRLFLVEPRRERPCVGRGIAEPIQHSGPVRRGDEHVVEIPERRLQANVLGDMCLPVVGAENNRVTLEELLRPAGRVEERADRGIASRQGFESPVGAMSVRGEVVVRQVVDEEVEAVARDEPATDRGRVAVDGAVRPPEDRKRCAGRIRLEQVVEEEALGPVGRERQSRQRGQVRGAAAVAGDVDRCGRQPGVLERFVDGDRLRAEVKPVHVDGRVEERARHSRGPHRPERGAVLDEPRALAVVPDQMRDAMDVRVRAGRNRREAHGCQRGERGDCARVGPLLGEERKGRRSTVADGRLEHRRRQPVDDDEDELLSLWQANAIRRNARRHGRAGGRPTRERASPPDIPRRESRRRPRSELQQG